MSDIEIEIKNSTVLITLKRERVLNALNLNMVRKIYKHIDDWNTNDEICGVILRGSGDRAFCAGGDIVAVYHTKEDQNNSLSYDFFREEYLLNLAIKKFTKPWISILNGIAMGGGLGLSVHGSHRIITEKTITAMPETAIGLFPDVGGSYFLSRMQGCLGQYLAITGNTMNSKDTLFSGIGTNFLDSKFLEIFISSISELEKYDINTINQILSEFTIEDENENFLNNQIENINKHFVHNSLGSIIKSLSDTDAKWENEILTTLHKKSPTSMAVTLRLLLIAKDISFEECLKTEFRVCQAMMKKQDFYEGVRANLVEKDRKPKWCPKDIRMVNEEIIKSHFVNLQDKELF